MQTFKTVKKEVEESVLESCMCNRCGDSLLTHPEYGSDGLHTEYHGGYGSSPLADMTSYSFDLCEPCLAWLFMQFKTPPTIQDQMAAADPTGGPGMTKEQNDHWARWHLECLACYVDGKPEPPYIPMEEK